MSKLATSLPSPDDLERTRVRKGPAGACDAYGDGDMEDWTAIYALRRRTNWARAQRAVDEASGVKIDPNAFRYHWNGKCWHWTAEQKAQIHDILNPGDDES